MSENIISKDGTIFPISLVVSAMRDSGYKNTAYALAELIDNSVQAKATLVDVICFEKSVQLGSRQSKRVQQIAVIDDGEGMEQDELRAALMFGNGTRLGDRSGIGRFGVGLPNASFSQGRKVEIWSWKNGHTNALYTFIDFDEIQQGIMTCVPMPEHKKLPEIFTEISAHDFNSCSGTIVVWSKLDDDRMTWKTSQSTIKHTTNLAGRIYRHLIKDGSVRIQLSTYDLATQQLNRTAPILPNDPLYLMEQTCTPGPYDTKAMFQPFGNPYEFKVQWLNRTSSIFVTCSLAKEETIELAGTRDRGHTPYGKHANENVGVSLVRAQRELLLDPSWANHSDPRDRWWGCEVAFSPDLDEAFGVVNNKQDATNWGQFAQMDWEDFKEDESESLTDVITRMKLEDDARSVIIDVSKYVKEQIELMRTELRNQAKGRRSRPSRHEKPDAPEIEDKASDKTKERSIVHPTERDKQIFNDSDREEYAKDLEQKGYSKEVAAEKAGLVLSRQRRIDYIEENWDGEAFFQIHRRDGGLSVVSLNSSHLFFQRLQPLLAEEIPLEDLTAEQAIEQLMNTHDVLHLLFAAWARLEEESNDEARKRLTGIRRNWGAMVNFYLDDEGID